MQQVPIRRHYKFSEKAVVVDVVDGELTETQRQLLQMLYSEVCSSWRALHDVRFKLLGLIPFVTVAVLVVLLPETGSTTGLPIWGSKLIAGMGFCATLGLLIYEIRNSALYDDMISRGRRIEAELGVQTGLFRGRLKPKHNLINHTTAITLIYSSALLGWGVPLIIL